MAKNLHPIDDSFREAFENFNPAPPPMVWENIEMAIQEEPKKRRWLFLPFAFCLVFTLGAISSYLWLGQKKSSTTTKEVFANNQNSTNSTNEGTNTVFNENTSSNPNINSLNEDFAFAETNNSSQNMANFISSKKTNVYSSKNNFDKNNTTATNSSTVDENTAKSLNENNTKNEDNTIVYNRDKIDLLNITPTLSPKDVSKTPILKFGPELECYSFGREKTKFYHSIEAFVGPEYAKRSLGNNTTEANKYAIARDSSERFVVAYSGGIRHSITSPSGIGLRYGISASHLVERFDFVDYYETRIIQPADPSLPATTVHGKHTAKTYNRLTTLDIPIQLGFQTLNDRNNWNFGAYAGVLMNLQFYKSGKILSPQGTTSKINKDLSVFNNKVGLSLIANVSLRRKLSEHWTLNIEPNATYQLKPLTVSSYLLTQKYWKAGVQLGLIYQF